VLPTAGGQSLIRDALLVSLGERFLIPSARVAFMAEDGPTLFDSEESSALLDGGGDLQTPAGLLALMSFKGVGSGRAIKLARAFGGSEAFNDASPEARKLAAGVTVEGFVSVRDVEPPHESVRIVGYFNDDYPQALSEIKDAPAVLWIRGKLPDPAPRVAIVGTRAPTEWGTVMARAAAADAAASGVSVVSGLALGIDIAAHRAVLEAGGDTIAVLGSGIDKPTPQEHAADAEEIVESGGCLLTEQAPGTPASSRTLVARNRLQSGLSAATIVVQCGIKSGTMSTARFALDQSRILALPQPPEGEQGEPENAGSLSLIGATPPPQVLRSRDDLAALLSMIG
jgi:DNA processing protein